jgi:cell filamentation protein
VSYLRTANERAAHRRVFYKDTETYVNKLDVHDRLELEAAERTLTAERAEQGFPPRANHKSYAGFKAIHRHLFQDLYSWAGKERRYTTGRGWIPFAVPEHITSWMEEQFKQLARERYLVGRTKAEFATAAARYANELNAAHPFIDGNGRTQRFWLRMLANSAGFELTLSTHDAKRWNKASLIGFQKSDHAPMARLIESRLKPLRPAAPPAKSKSRRVLGV